LPTHTDEASKKAVFFYASSAGMGLTSHFTDSVQDLYKNAEKFDFYLVSDAKEQNPGLWEQVEESIPGENIIKFNEIDYNTLNDRLSIIIEKYDRVVFHFQGITQILKTRKLIKKYKSGTIVTINSFSHGTWKRNIASFIYTTVILRYIDKAIFLSPFAWKTFTGSSLLFKKGKIAHIPFNLPRLEDQYIHEDETILDENDFNIVYLANFTKHKGHERFLNGIKLFLKEFTDVKIYFFGEGKRKAILLKKIKDAGLEKNIFCPGRIPRKLVPSILKKSSIALIFSGTETAGHTIIEPMMMGIPVISTRVGFGEYLIQDGINAIGISTNNDLYLALKRLKNDSILRKELGTNAKTMIHEFYKYDRMIKAYIDLYASL
jgi:glycosyltransferase involved in cell wall biosynthesis